MTPEEKQEIVNEVMEQVYRSLPEIVANLATSMQSHAERFMKFYENYPEFRDYPEIVGHTVSKIEGENPLKSYDDMLKLAVPKIRESIEKMGTIDLEPVKSERVDRSFIKELGKT